MIKPISTIPALPNLNPSANAANYASEFYIRLIKQIVTFERELNADEEIGLRLVSFGESVTIHVDNLGFHNPSLIIFYGSLTSGEKVTLIQHVTQISFLLISTKSTTPTRIGYKFKSEIEADSTKNK